MPAWSGECSAPAVGSAKIAGHPVGHGPYQSPTAPAITGRLWNGENSTSARLPDFSISDEPALQPCPGTPAMALGCTRTQADFGSRGLDPVPASVVPPHHHENARGEHSPLLHPQQGPAYTAALGSLLPWSDPAQALAFLLHGLGLQPLPRKCLQSLGTVRGKVLTCNLGKVEPSTKTILLCPGP